MDKSKKQSEAGSKPSIRGQLLTDDEMEMVSGGRDIEYSFYHCNDCNDDFGIPKIMTRTSNTISCTMCGGQKVEPKYNH